MMFGFKKERHKKAAKPEDLPLCRNDDVTVQISPTQRCLVNTAMATHIGTREYQQDAAYVCEPIFEESLAFGILCDGMGGMADGDLASSDVVAYMANRIAELAENEDIPSFFEGCAAAANKLIFTENQKHGRESGTTLVSVMIRRGGLYWLNVGDSRIYVIRKGEIAQVSRDHNFALELQEMVRAGQITRQQADEDPRRDALISYIGAPVLERMDVNRSAFALQYGDIILLCSDGLTKILTDAEILDVIANCGNDITGAAQALPLEAYDHTNGGMDNTSVILMQYLGVAQWNGSDNTKNNNWTEE